MKLASLLVVALGAPSVAAPAGPPAPSSTEEPYECDVGDDATRVTVELAFGNTPRTLSARCP